MPALRSLEGRVVVANPELAVDLSRAKVRLEGSSLWPPVEISAGSDGRFEFGSLSDGVFAIEAWIVGEGEQVGLASVPLENLQLDQDVVELRLDVGTNVNVRVVNAGNQPIAGAR